MRTDAIQYVKVPVHIIDRKNPTIGDNFSAVAR
jgi:hypothetical protein